MFCEESVWTPLLTQNFGLIGIRIKKKIFIKEKFRNRVAGFKCQQSQRRQYFVD